MAVAAYPLSGSLMDIPKKVVMGPETPAALSQPLPLEKKKNRECATDDHQDHQDLLFPVPHSGFFLFVPLLLSVAWLHIAHPLTLLIGPSPCLLPYIIFLFPQCQFTSFLFRESMRTLQADQAPAIK